MPLGPVIVPDFALCLLAIAFPVVRSSMRPLLLSCLRLPVHDTDCGEHRMHVVLTSARSVTLLALCASLQGFCHACVLAGFLLACVLAGLRFCFPAYLQGFSVPASAGLLLPQGSASVCRRPLQVAS